MLSEEALRDLVGDDALEADEEEVLKVVVSWIKGGGGGGEEGRGERLLGEIRYGLLTASRLAEVGRRAEEMVGRRQGALLRDLVDEALRRGGRQGDHDVRLCKKAFLRRQGLDVAWGEYAAGGRPCRLVRHEGDVWSQCGSKGRVYGGLSGGDLIEWDQVTLGERQRLRCEGLVGDMYCMTICGDLVISGHSDYCLRVWNTATGNCDHVLRGHTSTVWCMASWEQYLVSGYCDKTITVWDIGGLGQAPIFLGTIAVHTEWVWAMVVWQGRLISGSQDESICVSDIATRQHEATLSASHTGPVRALALSGGMLLSTSTDGSIGIWALGSWESLRRIWVSEHVPDAQFCSCLAVSGSMLLCGGASEHLSGFVVVLNAATMSCEHTLRVDKSVRSLLNVRGEVWGILSDCSVVEWGNLRGGGGDFETEGQVRLGAT